MRDPRGYDAIAFLERSAHEQDPSLVMLTLLIAAQAASATTYIVVFEETESSTGFEVGGSNLLNLNAALGAVKAAGGVVTSDMIVDSANPLFVDVLRANPLAQAVAEDRAFKIVHDEPGTPAPVDPLVSSTSGEDPLEFGQWDMRMIHAPEARHLLGGGNRAVKVAVLDDGLDPLHQDFWSEGRTNIDWALSPAARELLPWAPDHRRRR